MPATSDVWNDSGRPAEPLGSFARSVAIAAQQRSRVNCAVRTRQGDACDRESADENLEPKVVEMLLRQRCYRNFSVNIRRICPESFFSAPSSIRLGPFGAAGLFPEPRQPVIAS
jgi:hypothetical protein